MLTSLLICATLASSPRVSASVLEDEKVTASDAAADKSFGDSVAINEMTVVVGAPGDFGVSFFSGAAYVYDCSVEPCVEVSKLTASDAAGIDVLGVSVAISGATAVIGAFRDDDGGSDSGSAYVFDLATCGPFCNETSKLTASDAEAGDFFGGSVAIDGDLVVIGAIRDDDGGDNSGSAYVFDLTTCGPVCTETSKLTASDAEAFDQFGVSVAISGVTAVVGSRLDDDAGSGSGSAYLFDLATCGVACTEADKLVASDGAANDEFGWAVAASDTTVVVGAPRNSHPPAFQAGAAYLFDCSALPCVETSKLIASDGAAGDRFGWSVAVSGNAIVVGASGDDDAGSDSGAAYVFGKIGCGAVCTEGGKLLPTDGASFEDFGDSVSVHDTTAIVGAPGDGHAGSGSGAAYLFLAVPATNTPVGFDVMVQPEDTSSGDSPVTMTFSSVIEPGVTTLTTGASGPEPPSGFGLGDPPLYYDLETTAVFDGTVEVCIDYSGTSQDTNDAAEAGLRLTHFDGSVWEDVTTSLDTVANLICGEVVSLSPFGVAAPLNQPPIADAGPDQTIEWTAGGAVAELDGSGSSDPDGHTLSNTWTGSFDEGGGSVSGIHPSVTLPTLGVHVLQLTVDDGNGAADSDSVRITVEDTTPPDVIASLVPAGEVEEDEGLFQVVLGCSDSCDEDPTITTATLNGLAVQNGQLVELELKKKQKVKLKGGIPEIEAPAFELVVTCRDASGNEATATAQPVFSGDGDDDDDSDSDSDSDGG